MLRSLVVPTGATRATDDWNIAANDAWDNYQSDVTDALADWTTDEAGPRGDYNDEMQDAQDDWITDENTAWSSFSGIEPPARNQRSSDIWLDAACRASAWAANGSR